MYGNRRFTTHRDLIDPRALLLTASPFYLERQGLLERDTGNLYFSSEAVDAPDEDPSNQLLES